MNDKNLLEIKNVSKYYGDYLAVDQISFSLRKGEVKALIGPNGAGKTTLMKLLAFINRIDTGEYFWNGTKVSYEVGRKKYGPLIGLVTDPISLYYEMKGDQFLRFCSNILNLKTAESKEQIERLIEELSLQNFINKRISSMSKGMRQRVALCSALIGNPDCLILDEPTSGLDPMSNLELREVLHRLKKNHSIFLSSHNLHEVENLADTVLLIDNGVLRFDGTINELRSRYKESLVYYMNFENMDDTSLSGISEITKVERLDNIDSQVRLKISIHDKSQILEIQNICTEKKIVIHSMNCHRETLEDMFVREFANEKN